MLDNKILLNHFKNPRNFGELSKATAIGEAISPTCGDTTKMYLNIKNNKIVDVKFFTLGCGVAIASGSMLTELIKGLSVEETLEISPTTVANALGEFPLSKVHCIELAIRAVKSAISNYQAD